MGSSKALAPVALENSWRSNRELKSQQVRKWDLEAHQVSWGNIAPEQTAERSPEGG